MSDSPDDATLDLYGMKVRLSDFIPKDVLGFQQPGERVQWFGLDPAGPEGDYSVVRINPTYRIDKGLLDDLTDEQIAASDRVSIELRAMRLAADIYETRERVFNGATTQNNWAEQGRRFCLSDLESIMENMRRQQHDRNVKLIEALIAAGMTVTVTDAADRPLVALPPEYKGALDEVVADRKNRDAMENVYRDWGLWPTFPADSLFGEPPPGMSHAEYRKLFDNDWSEPE